jgi:light-regulated signal transduction histidine kinase (bacteriophytochrome)
MLSLLVEETDGALTDDAEDYVQRAVAGAERMRSLIDDLLLYSRMGRREAQRRDVDLGALADDVVEGLGAVIASSAACVEVTTPLPTVRADPVEVRQILQNLVSNGLKFNAGPTPRVTISAQREGAAWRVTVADDGIGIAPEFADRVFGPFKRLHTRDAYPGTGIGLAICRRIVERRGGRISLEHLPRGTAVHFTIPDAASDLEVAA